MAFSGEPLAEAVGAAAKRNCRCCRLCHRVSIKSKPISIGNKMYPVGYFAIAITISTCFARAV